MSKKCPVCGLVNPVSALRCDCGYNFRTTEIEVKAQEPESSTLRHGVLAIGTICAFFAVLIFVAGLMYKLEGTEPVPGKELEDTLMNTFGPASLIGFIIGYAVGWRRPQWGGMIIILSGLLITLPLLIFAGNSGILLFGVPTFFIGILYLLVHWERSSSRVE